MPYYVKKKNLKLLVKIIIIFLIAKNKLEGKMFFRTKWQVIDEVIIFLPENIFNKVQYIRQYSFDVTSSI